MRRRQLRGHQCSLCGIKAPADGWTVAIWAIRDIGHDRAQIGAVMAQHVRCGQTGMKAFARQAIGEQHLVIFQQKVDIDHTMQGWIGGQYCDNRQGRRPGPKARRSQTMPARAVPSAAPDALARPANPRLERPPKSATAQADGAQMRVTAQGRSRQGAASGPDHGGGGRCHASAPCRPVRSGQSGRGRLVYQ